MPSRVTIDNFTDLEAAFEELQEQIVAALTPKNGSPFAEKSLAAAGNYTAGDVLSESATAATAWYFPNCASKPGGSFWITGATASCTEDGISALALRVKFFSKNPLTSELRHNVAEALAEA